MGTIRSVRIRLKDILRQYELRERHFECVIRSKELEVLLSRARAAEQKQLSEGRPGRLEEEVCSPFTRFFQISTELLILSYVKSRNRTVTSEETLRTPRMVRRCSLTSWLLAAKKYVS